MIGYPQARRGTPAAPRRRLDGLGRVMGEVAAGVAVGVGQRDPQLDAVQDRRRGGGDLRMADARARPSSGSASPGRTNACTPALSRCSISPLEQPADGLQPGVRVRRHVHADAVADVVRAVVVGEAPRADQRPLPLRQRASHPDGARPAQRDFPGMQHAGECRCRASHFGRRGIGVAHRFTVALPRHRRADHVEVVVVDPEDAEAELVSPARLVLDEVELRRSAV